MVKMTIIIWRVCCGHGGFLGPGSTTLGFWPPASLAFPNSRKLPFVEFGASIFYWIFLFFLLVLETPLIMCERNCHGLTCTILLKKLNFLLAIFALEQGGKGSARHFWESLREHCRLLASDPIRHLTRWFHAKRGQSPCIVTVPVPRSWQGLASSMKSQAAAPTKV